MAAPARRTRRFALVLAAAGLLAAAGQLAGCGAGQRSHPAAAAGWPVWGGDAQNTHYAPIARITRGNVHRLALAWRRREGVGQSGWETFPVVVGDTMYYTTATDAVYAVAAATGRVRWTYTPQVNFLADPHVLSVVPVNRGVTVAGGRVFTVTADDQMIALDARSGAPLWDVRVADPATGAVLNSEAVAWHGEIIVGGPAGAAGLAGFVAAYRARDGKALWRTRVVPARHSGWMRGSGADGGGDVWMPPVVDPRTGTVYAATGNPSPAFAPQVRRGCDRWTDATVALDARTGRLEWGYSALCGDAWDYDTSQSPILFSLLRGGRRVPVVADASKAGFVYVLDARTGRRIARSPSLVRYSQPHRIPTAGGAVVCPGIFGGIEYGPSAYSARTGLLYVPATDACMRYRTARDTAAARGDAGADQLDGTATPLPGATGLVAALRPGTGQVVWRRRLPAPDRGGVLATAGGLVFTGDDDGRLYALDARTGEIVWRRRIGLRFGSAPLAYEIDGRDYLAVAAGGSSASTAGSPLAPSGGELYVFALPR